MHPRKKYASHFAKLYHPVPRQRIIQSLPLHSSRNVLLLGRHAPFNLHDYLTAADTLKSQFNARGIVPIIAENRMTTMKQHMPSSAFIYARACCALDYSSLYQPILFHPFALLCLSRVQPSFSTASSSVSLLSLSLSLSSPLSFFLSFYALGSLIHPCGPYKRELSHPSTRPVFHPSQPFPASRCRRCRRHRCRLLTPMPSGVAHASQFLR